MTPLALTPPASEPASLAEAKAFLRLGGSEEDALLATLITAARLMVEAASGRMLIDQHWRLVLDAWPGEGVVRLPLSPVSAVTAARVFDAAGAPQPLDAELLALERGSDPPLIRFAESVPQPGRGRAGIEIDVVAGYGADAENVPAPLRQAVMRLALRWFEHRGDVVSRDQAALPREIAALIAPYRRMRI